MGNKRILVVEDDPLNMKLVQSLLTIGNYDVVAVDDAEKGIKLVYDYRPDLILMDIALPGMSGLEATRTLKANPVTAKIPIVALTASAMKGDKQKALDGGCSGYITKPIETKIFYKSIVKRFFKNRFQTISC